MSTKEKILFEALNLFSVRGYEAVSMRDISGVVGIRESSIYKHYSGKQDILDNIVEMAKERINYMYEKLSIPNKDNVVSISEYASMDIDDFADMCMKMFNEQINDEVVYKFRQLLTIEQYRNADLREIFIELFIDRALNYQEKVFEFLIEKHVILDKSAKIMAIEFFSPFFMLHYKMFNDKENLCKMLYEHTVHFIKSHLLED